MKLHFKYRVLNHSAYANKIQKQIITLESHHIICVFFMQMFHTKLSVHHHMCHVFVNLSSLRKVSR